MRLKNQSIFTVRSTAHRQCCSKLDLVSTGMDDNTCICICIAPYGCNFRGAVARECANDSEKREDSKPERMCRMACA